MATLHPVTPFRFWVQKILPLVYDDSLSYYELLNKVVAKLNETIEFFNEDVMAEITEAVSSYFAEVTYNEDLQRITLNVTNEVSNNG